ncbi:MAG TPA: DUF222 domain-containing protein [Candidatus Dormibacteraeota bacterium]|nr:DUF222 domain-containing protein [Candidatus Dormibacteraeota bacterium]
MSDELDQLELAVRRVELADGLDPTRLRSLADRLEGKFAQIVHRSTASGDHQMTGNSPVSWVASTCSMTPTSASDRLCVGAQLEHMPRVAAALSSGEIGYQCASVICHLRDKLGERRGLLDEDLWISFAREHRPRNLRWIAQHVRYLLDPDGFDRDTEEDFEQRYLHLSPLGGMFKLDAVLDPETGAALRAAIDGLSKRLGEGDTRTPKQRRADSFSEVVRHALDRGTLPRRNRARPHITVTTTVEALRQEIGAPASELLNGSLISSRSVQRLACDGVLSRVVKADSVVIDVGRATPSVSPAQWRALKSRHTTCGWPGCDRPISWTSPHHIEFRSHGGHSTMGNLLPLCYHHHRLVHEGGWQIIRAGDGLKFISPPHLWGGAAKRRWGERAA